MDPISWRVADEYDAEAFERLDATLLSMGYPGGLQAMVGTSNATCAWHFEDADGTLTVTAETYVGLIVAGPEPCVARVRACYEAWTATRACRPPSATAAFGRAF